MVTANSWSRRPTIPPMNSTGMNTAPSEHVIEMMVKPISREPRSAACIRSDGDGEFVEQAADDSAHEQHRDEHGAERARHRDDGEADLARAAQRGLHPIGW